MANGTFERTGSMECYKRGAGGMMQASEACCLRQLSDVDCFWVVVHWSDLPKADKFCAMPDKAHRSEI